MFEEIILQLYAHKDNLSKDFLMGCKRTFARTKKRTELPSHTQLLHTYHALVKNGTIQKTIAIEELLKKRAIRSQSGIVAVQVLTKPYRCPGACIFCPNDPTMPKSYIQTEPGAMRALLNQFDPYKQVYNRLLSLTLTGHQTDKIEMIVLGGTRDVYPDDYKTEFITSLYDACNTFQAYFDALELHAEDNKVGTHFAATQSQTDMFIQDILPKISTQSLEKAQEINETAGHRVIGLTIETRPEYVTEANCKQRRKLGITRIEMGLQSTHDDILAANQRGHTIQQAKDAICTLRQFGYKFCLHMMPGLYMSNYAKDLESMKELYNNPAFRPDEIKFYPTSVIPNTQLYTLYKEGKYTPLTTQEISTLIEEIFCNVIPPYTRIKRLIRDIPATEIEAGSRITNLSQLSHTRIQKKLQTDPNVRAKVYARLYDNFHIFSTIAETITHIQKTQKNTDTHTYILPFDELDKKQRIEHAETIRNFVSLDTRSREIRNKNTQEVYCTNMVIRAYLSSVGQEYFISIEDALGFLYGFVRLLLPEETNTIDREGLGNHTAIIRELHIYGKVEKIGATHIDTDTQESVQHTGLGAKLVQACETIAQKFQYTKLSIISGIGVKGYYKKLGYKNEGTYMTKKTA